MRTGAPRPTIHAFGAHVTGARLPHILSGFLQPQEVLGPTDVGLFWRDQHRTLGARPRGSNHSFIALGAQPREGFRVISL
jgi:hypothetical protein